MIVSNSRIETEDGRERIMRIPSPLLCYWKDLGESRDFPSE
jgi:hypothetical protein